MDTLYEAMQADLGLVIDQVKGLREHIDQHNAEHERAYQADMRTMRSSFTRHSGQLADHEERITALEHQQQS